MIHQSMQHCPHKDMEAVRTGTRALQTVGHILRNQGQSN
jgi:hypothetical protein